jgi:hypothetical protein
METSLHQSEISRAMTLVPVLEYTDADRLLADYAARRRRLYQPAPKAPPPVPKLVVVAPEPEPEPVAPAPVDDVIYLPNFLPFRRSELIANGALRQCDARVILKNTSQITGVRILDIQSKRKNKEVILPRMIACWVMREHTLMSLPQIGRSMGGRDHSTVKHSIDKIERLREISPDVRRLSDEIAASACAEMRA